MITIKHATTKDITLIRSIAEIAFPDTYKEILSEGQLAYMMEWMYSEKSLEKQMIEEKNTFYIAYYDNTAVGYVSIRPEEEEVYHLEKIYVLPEYQNKKIGKALFLKAIKGIKEMHPGKCQMHLNVNRNNNALHFYEHMGMTKLSEGDFPIGNGYYMNDYIMSLTI